MVAAFVWSSCKLGSPAAVVGVEINRNTSSYTHTIAPGSNAAREGQVDMLDQRVSLMFNPQLKHRALRPFICGFIPVSIMVA